MKYLLLNVKSLPKEIKLTVGSADENGITMRHIPTVYTRDDSCLENGLDYGDCNGYTYYLNKDGKDVFYVYNTDFGTVAAINECDETNLEMPQDFESFVNIICEKFIPFSDPVKCEKIPGAEINNNY